MCCHRGLTSFQLGLRRCASCVGCVVVLAPLCRYGRLLLGVWLDSHVCPRPNPAHIRWQLTAAVVVTLFTLAFDVRAAQVRVCSAQPIVNAATHGYRPEVRVACLEWMASYRVHRAPVAGHHPRTARLRWHAFARTPVCGGCFAESSPCMCAVANATNVVLRGP